MAQTGFRKGNRIETSGQGRTARWPYGTGIVTSSRRGYVYVVWDGTHFEDEMEPLEVRFQGSRGLSRMTSTDDTRDMHTLNALSEFAVARVLGREVDERVSRGGLRAGAGRKPLPNGRVNRIFVFEPLHEELLAAYRERHGLADDSKAIRHLLEHAEEIA